MNTGSVVSQPVADRSQFAGVVQSVGPILLIVVFFYFMIIRPQQKREADKKLLQGNLRRGDGILMSSGMYGTIHKIIDDQKVVIELSEGVRVTASRECIVSVLEKSVAKTESAEHIDDKDVVDESGETNKSVSKKQSAKSSTGGARSRSKKSEEK